MNKATKQRMIEAKSNYLRVKHPLFTEQDIRCLNFVDKTDTNANGLTRCIIDFLTWNGHQAERINTMGRRIDKTKVATDIVGRTRTIGSVEWQKGTGTKGSADISATIKPKGVMYGVSVKIEVKIGRDKQSSHQRNYESQVNQAGGVYIIAKDMQGFIEWYDGFVGNENNLK